MPRTPRPSPSPLQAVVLSLLVLIPILFYRGTAEQFEVPKVSLLSVGALAILAWALAGELGALAQEGPAGWIRSAASRLAALPRRDPLGTAVLAFLASAVASTLASTNPALSFFGAAESTAGLKTALATAAVYFASRSLGGSPAMFDRLAGAAGLGAAVASGYAILQLLELDAFHWARTATFGGAFRVFGTLGHPNFLGAYLAMALPLVAHRLRRASNPASRLGWLATGAASLAAIAATLSRGAWVALAAGALVWVLASRRAAEADPGGAERPARTGAATARAPRERATGARFAAIAAAVLGAGILAVLARSSLMAPILVRLREIASLSAPSTHSRLHIWNAGLRMAADHPLLGAGLDSFGAAFPAYRTAAYWRVEWGGTPTKAHNEIIEILATQGILGGIAAAAVLVLAAAAAWRALKSRTPNVRQAAVAAAASLAAFGVQDLASFTVVALGTLAAALAGWTGAAAQRPAPELPRARPRPPWALGLSIGLAALAMIPVTVGPWRAQRAEHRALLAPDRTEARAAALRDAWSAAPWDGRYPGRLALSQLKRAEVEPDPARRGSLLDEARRAASGAIAQEPSSGYYYSLAARIETERALLPTPAAGLPDVRLLVRAALERDPTNAEIRGHLAYALVRLGATGEAREIETGTAGMYPDLGQPYSLLGLLALQERRWGDGADTLRLAVERDWRNETASKAAAWSNLSAAYIELGRHAEAREAALRALESDPTSRAAADNRAVAEEGLRRTGAGGAAP